MKVKGYTTVFDKDGNALLLASDTLTAEPAVEEPEVEEELVLPEQSVKPDDVDWPEWSRRQGVVRSLAREFDEVDVGDIREHLEGKTTRDLSDEEIDQIKHDVISHRVTDISDVLDSQLRSTVDQMKRSRRTVRVSAPRGWMKRAFGHLDQHGVEQVCAHLISRGHDPSTIKSRVVSRVADEKVRDTINEKIDNGDLRVEG